MATSRKVKIYVTTGSDDSVRNLSFSLHPDFKHEWVDAVNNLPDKWAYFIRDSYLNITISAASGMVIPTLLKVEKQLMAMFEELGIEADFV